MRRPDAVLPRWAGLNGEGGQKVKRAAMLE
jgi:hypothetical protein